MLAVRRACTAPLSADGDTLLCDGCARRWPLESLRPLTVRLAEPAIAARGEQFEAAPQARTGVRRALRQWHTRRDERFAPRIPALPDAQLPAIRDVYKALPAGRRSVLDVGGGAGRWRSLLGDPADYTIVDVIPPERLALKADLTYVQADAAALPFSDGAFELVLMVEVLHHLVDPAAALAGARRVLAADGTLVLSTRQAWRTLGAPADYYRFTRYGLEHLLRSAGLQTRQLVPLGGPASVVTVALENSVSLLRKPIAKQLVTHSLWRLAAVLDRTVFREDLEGPSPEVSGWLVVATPADQPG